MLNYAETASGSTNVPLAVPYTLDHMQATTALHPLAALLAHPKFQQGLAFAQEEFLSEYEEAPLSEEEMIEEVEMNLSRRVTERCKQLSRFDGSEPSSYLHNLGYVLGIINRGLTYAR